MHEGYHNQIDAFYKMKVSDTIFSGKHLRESFFGLETFDLVFDDMFTILNCFWESEERFCRFTSFSESKLMLSFKLKLNFSFFISNRLRVNVFPFKYKKIRDV